VQKLLDLPKLVPSEDFIPTRPFNPDVTAFVPKVRDEEEAIITASTSVAADTTGVKNIGSAVALALELIPKDARRAELIIEYAWAATADGYFRLRDATAGVDIKDGASKTGGESGTETITIDDVEKLIEGNSLQLQANVTVAGAAGETVTVTSAKLTLKRYKRD